MTRRALTKSTFVMITDSRMDFRINLGLFFLKQFLITLESKQHLV